jgi:superfamily II DNA or RNA helicase
MDEFRTNEELIAANQRLQAENKRLNLEIERLKNLLMNKHPSDLGKCEAKNEFVEGINESGTNRVMLSLQEKIALFQSLFRGREDVFARRWYSKVSGKSGYQPVCLNEWNPQLCNKRQYKCAECPNRQLKSLTYEDYYKHLEGKSEDGCDVIGLYVILNDNTCFFLCVDFDDKLCEHGYQNDVQAFVNVCDEWDVPCSIERSRSGNGAHVWIFFSESLSAIKARRLGNIILTEAMTKDGRVSFKSYDRIFPNQDSLPEGGFGNLIALPLQGKARKNGNAVFVDRHFIPYNDQWMYLAAIEKVSEKRIDRLLRIYGQRSELGELSTTNEAKPWELPALPELSTEDFPKEIEIVKSNALYIPLKDLSSKVLNYIKRIASFKNPEFYARQGMRFSTYNVPRIISCADIMDEYIALPRGCEDAIIDLLQIRKVNYRIEDKTNCGESISVSFNGELRSEQKIAIKQLLQHSNGVLNATTAFGKTVTAIGLIAKIKVSTLILVHTRALLNQWKSCLETFLQIDYVEERHPHIRGRKKTFSPFGTLGSGGNTLHGKVDIALIQSCLSKDGVKPFIRDYGMVLVDECHHVSAINFEQILKYSNAHYVYGFTATPIRKDGHQPIIFMQCGPIRYSADAKAQMESQTFERFLIPRFTSYRELSDDKSTYVQMIQKMVEDKQRNLLIINDVCMALEEKRTPIILTTLTSHVEVLSKLLTDRCKRVITLVGSESAREKRLKMDVLQTIRPEEPLVIVATGKYVGEGFDYPRLDTLFLALPISWKGNVEQYAGRLHREYSGKKEVRVYDYIDIHVPMCDIMYRRRLKGYALVGYKLFQNVSDNLFGTEQNVIYTGKNYQNTLLDDLSIAKRSVVVSTTKLWFHKYSTILNMFEKLLRRGVEVIVFLRQSPEGISQLSSIGVIVKVKEDLTIQSIIIDKHTTWYGSVNYLGYSTEDDNAIRLKDEVVADEMINMLYNK